MSTPPPLTARVEQVEARVVSVALDPKIITRYYTIPTIELVVVRMRDADGVEGFSTLWCFGMPQARVLLAALDYLTPFACRATPGPISESAAALRREINFLGFKGVSVFALSALDMALHDLACRRAGVSLGSALGRRLDRIPVYWSGLFSNQTLPELLDEVDTKLAEGFRAFKVRTGKPSLREDVERVAAVADRLPDGATLMIDAVQSWSVEQAIAAAGPLAELGPIWLEDPLVHSDYAGLAAVVESSPIPIATGENEYLRDGFDQIFAAGPRYLLADLERVGGVTEWLAVAESARTHGAVLTPHVYPQVAIQLCAALDQAEQWIEYIPWWDALLTEPLRVEDGAVAVPDRPGSGLELDLDAVDAHAVTAWMPLGEEG